MTLILSSVSLSIPSFLFSPLIFRSFEVSHPPSLRDSLKENDPALSGHRLANVCLSVCVRALVVRVAVGVIWVISSGYRQPSPGERVSLSKVEINNETHKSLFFPTAPAAYKAHSGHITTTITTTGFLHLLCLLSVYSHII